MGMYAQPITPSELKRMDLVNTQFVADNNSILYMSKDGSTLYSVNPANTAQLMQSVNGGAWTAVFTFTGAIQAAVEPGDGEMIVGVGQYPTVLYKSSGFAASRTAATWAAVLTMATGAYVRPWGLNDFCFGTDGKGITIEYGLQTTSASQDKSVSAVSVYTTSNFGSAWTFSLDVRQANPRVLASSLTGSGIHGHGCAYDQANNMFIALFGDNTGVGGQIAPQGQYLQIAYMYAEVGTWDVMPAGPEFSDQVPQWTAVAVTKSAIVLGCDAMRYPMFHVLPKTGYRKFGRTIPGPTPSYVGGSGGANQGFVHKFIRRYDKDYEYPLSTEIYQPNGYRNNYYRMPNYVSPDGTGLNWQEGFIEPDLITYPSVANANPSAMYGPNRAGQVYFNFRRVPITFTGTGSQSGTVVTITAVASGALAVGSIIYGGAVEAVVTSLGTGTGGTGTYNVSVNQSTASTSLSAGTSTQYKAVGDWVGPVDKTVQRGGTATIADGGTIPHGLGVVPSRRDAKQTVANRQVFVTAADATNLTVAVKDLTGAAITAAEPVYWTAGA